MLADAVEFLHRQATPGALLLVGLALGAAIALYGGRRYVAPRLVSRNPAIVDPSRRSRLLAAVAVLVLGAVPAIAGSWIVWVVFDSVDLVPSRLEPIVHTLLRGLAFVAFTHALIDALFAPGHQSWRLLPLSDSTASRIRDRTVAIAAVMMTGKVVESINQAIAAAIPIAIVSRALFALVCAVLLGQMLRGFSVSTAQDEACLALLRLPPRRIRCGGLETPDT